MDAGWHNLIHKRILGSKTRAKIAAVHYAGFLGIDPIAVVKMLLFALIHLVGEEKYPE